MRRIINLLLGVMVFGPWTVAAQETKALSLQQCIDYALANTAAAKNARIDIALQKAQNAEVTGRALPQISAQGRYQYYSDLSKMPIKASSFSIPGAPAPADPNAITVISLALPHNANLGITANQVLFNGSIFVALQARNTLLELAKNNADLKNEDIRYNVQKAYLALLIAHKQFALMNESLALLRKTTNDVSISYRSGVVEKLDVDRMEVQLSNLESDSIGLGNMIEVSEQMLKYTIGLDLNTPIILTDTAMADNTEAASAVLLHEAAYEDRLAFQLSLTSVKLKEYDLKRYHFEGLPTLSAFGNAGYNYAGSKLSDLVNVRYLTSSYVGLQLDIPLFDGLQRRNRVKAAKLKLDQARNDMDNLKLGIDYQTKAARISLNNALQTVSSRKRTMELANSVLDLSRRKYKAGVGSNQDVVLAQTDYLNAQNNYFSALQNVFNAQADLQKSLGLLK